MEQQLWRAQSQFSFWYWKWKGPVKWSPHNSAKERMAQYDWTQCVIWKKNRWTRIVMTLDNMLAACPAWLAASRVTETGHSTSGLYTSIYILCPAYTRWYTMSTTTTIVWEPETIVGNLMCMCGGGVRGQGWSALCQLGFRLWIKHRPEHPMGNLVGFGKKDKNW